MSDNPQTTTNEYVDIEDPFICLACDICTALGVVDKTEEKIISVKKLIKDFMELAGYGP